jgi:hypothetical protein
MAKHAAGKCLVLGFGWQKLMKTRRIAVAAGAGDE